MVGTASLTEQQRHRRRQGRQRFLAGACISVAPLRQHGCSKVPAGQHAMISCSGRLVADSTRLQSELQRRRFRTSMAIVGFFALRRSRKLKCLSGTVALQCSSDDGGQDSRPSGVTEEDKAMLQELRRRADDLSAKEEQRTKSINENWAEGRARVGPVAALDDWVRRVTFLEKDLFVGTASTGVQRFRLGDNEPRQRYAVMGKSSVSVPADHQAETDPETSVTSLCWDGRWLAAGLAGG